MQGRERDISDFKAFWKNLLKRAMKGNLEQDLEHKKAQDNHNLA